MAKNLCVLRVVHDEYQMNQTSYYNDHMPLVNCLYPKLGFELLSINGKNERSKSTQITYQKVESLHYPLYFFNAIIYNQKKNGDAITN